MHKIDTENRTAQDEFEDEDVSQHIEGTDLNAAWFNTVQRELCNLVTGAGMSLDPNDDTQVKKAVAQNSLHAYQVFATTWAVPECCESSTVLLIKAQNMSITGTFNDGALVIILPKWTGDETASITVSYGNTNVVIRPGCAVMGVCYTDGVSTKLISTLPFATATSNGAITPLSLETRKVVDKGFVTDSSAVGPNNEYRPWQLMSNWSVGQVKRVMARAGVTESYRVIYYVNTLGETGTFELYPNSYRELMCIGSVETSAGKYAVFATNGVDKLPDTSVAASAANA